MLTSEASFIMGNISRLGERIYHVPGGQNYSPTRINQSDIYRSAKLLIVQYCAVEGERHAAQRADAHLNKAPWMGVEYGLGVLVPI